MSRMARDGWQLVLASGLALLAWAMLSTAVQSTSIGVTVTRGTTVALPAAGLTPVLVYTNEHKTAMGIAHRKADGTFTYSWLKVESPASVPEVGDVTIVRWTWTQVGGNEWVLTDAAHPEMAPVAAVTRPQDAEGR